MTDMPTILIVDDDARLRKLLTRYLTENQYKTYEAPSADEARDVLKLITFDLVIMDVMMPGTNGHDMVRELREQGNNIPVLMLTAMGNTDHRITGLEAGADDYLSKPFEPRELILRIQNILKRTSKPTTPTYILFGDCSFDPKTGLLTKDEQLIPLTGAETELLRLLCQHAGTVVSREDLSTWLETDNTRTIDVQILRLRKKIEPDADHPICIQTIRGQGYTLVTK